MRSAEDKGTVPCGLSFKFFSVPRERTGTGNILRRLLMTWPNSGSPRLYLSIRRYSGFRDHVPLDLQSRSERRLCMRSSQYSSPILRAGSAMYRVYGQSLSEVGGRTGYEIIRLRSLPRSSRYCSEGPTFFFSSSSERFLLPGFSLPDSSLL